MAQYDEMLQIFETFRNRASLDSEGDCYLIIDELGEVLSYYGKCKFLVASPREGKVRHANGKKYDYHCAVIMGSETVWDPYLDKPLPLDKYMEQVFENPENIEFKVYGKLGVLVALISRNYRGLW
ncbi:MAG: hypothetical protein J4428_05070 [Candidatus Aenigmarchaeota archaeon]|nr:hypothetical protein [Candidatus Aenigmarchaeota archaeon]